MYTYVVGLGFLLALVGGFVLFFFTFIKIAEAIDRRYPGFGGVFTFALLLVLATAYPVGMAVLGK